jgi:hypothetical protein
MNEEVLSSYYAFTLATNPDKLSDDSICLGACCIGQGSCSELRTSERLLDNMMLFQLEFAENIAGVLLTLSKNVLELWLLSTFGDSGSLRHDRP